MIMQKSSLFTGLLLSAVAFTSCSKLGKLSADNFTVTPNPLEATAGQVPATINGIFPEKYMKTKAVVTVTPVLRYAGGEAVGQPATFQGEKVADNHQTISYRIGGNYTMKTTFAYVPAMAKSELYLTFDARIGKKVQKVPEVKVADGVLATYTLAQQTLKGATPAVAPDAYEYVVNQKQEANIRFLIQQAQVRSSELKTQSVQDFIKMLREIKQDNKTYELTNVEIAAYASPDGGEKLNARLSENREKTTNAFVKQELKKAQLATHVDSRYTAEDWEGFQELVKASKIQDKEVILRLLSMYQDPEERERQIRNLSVGFTELADEILPQLRRSRMAINYAVIGRSDDEIMELINKNEANKLSVEELVYAAGTISEDKAEQKRIYETTMRLYPNDYRALNNLAAMAYTEGDLTAATAYLDRIPANANLAEANVNRGLIALINGKVTEAEAYIAKGTGAATQQEALGNLNIMQGHYGKAAQLLAGSKTPSLALAQILSRNYEGARTTLDGLRPTALTYYLGAITAMRSGNESLALSQLEQSFALDASLKVYAAKDLEFASISRGVAFQNLVK